MKPKKDRFWAVILDDDAKMPGWSGFCFTWDKKHPEEKRKEESVLVYAIYPKKKDALDDAKFRGSCSVKKVEIKIL